MDGRALSVAEVERIADLESREVLLAKLAGAMKANLPRPPACSTLPRRRSPACSPRCKRRRPDRVQKQPQKPPKSIPH